MTDPKSAIPATCRQVAGDLLSRGQVQWHASAPNGNAEREIGKTNPPMPPRPLKPRMVAAAALLVGGYSVASAARALKIGRRTVFRWLKQAAFKSEIDRRLAELRVSAACAARPRPARTPAPRIPQPTRQDLDFVASLIAETNADLARCRAARGGVGGVGGALRRGSARFGTVEPPMCKTNPPRPDTPRTS